MTLFNITTRGSSLVANFQCSDDQNIYDAFLQYAKGTNLETYVFEPCGIGACSTCAAKLISGTVNNEEQSFLSDDEVKAGYILACVAYPTSDCTLIV